MLVPACFFFLSILAQLVVGQNVTSPYALNDLLSTLPNISNFTSYLESLPDLLSVLSDGNATILAPSDDAFTSYLATTSLPSNNSEALSALLQYHAIRGPYSLLELEKEVQFLSTLLIDPKYSNVTGGQRIGVYPTSQGIQFESGIKTRSNLTAANQLFAGDNGHGVIHIIDRVLYIPASQSDTAADTGLDGVISIEVSNPTSPKIYEGIDVTPDWSFFLPNRTTIDLGSLPTDVLFDLETYHFVQGQVYYSPDLKDGLQMQSIEGHNLTVTVAPNGTKYINDAEIIYSDYITDEGVMHVLSHEVNPNKTDARPDLSAPTNSTTSTFPPTATESGAAPASSNSSSSLSAGAKAGIGVGCALGGIFLIGLLLVLLRRMKKKKSATHLVSRDEKPQVAVEMPHPRGSHELGAPGAGTHWELEGEPPQERRIYEM